MKPTVSLPDTNPFVFFLLFVFLGALGNYCYNLGRSSLTGRRRAPNQKKHKNKNKR